MESLDTFLLIVEAMEAKEKIMKLPTQSITYAIFAAVTNTMLQIVIKKTKFCDPRDRDGRTGKSVCQHGQKSKRQFW